LVASYLAVTSSQDGSDAAAYGRETMLRWRAWFYKRLVHHITTLHEYMGHKTDVGARTAPSCCAPRIVAFTGKRQFSMLFEPPLKCVFVCVHVEETTVLGAAHCCVVGCAGGAAWGSKTRYHLDGHWDPTRKCGCSPVPVAEQR